MAKGFSILEIMVVLALIGILSVIAVPQFRDYLIRARVSAALPIMDSAVQDIIFANQRGLATSPMVVNGVSLTTGTAASFNQPPIIRAQYWQPSSGGVTTASQFLICFHLTGLTGITSYVAPTAGTNGSYSRICTLIDFSTDTGYSIKCGDWLGVNVLEIPVAYRPAGCKCTSMSTGGC